MRDDDDIKIAPPKFKAPAPGDSGEEAARQFLEQKELGNIDKARALGHAYANAILQFDDGPLGGLGKPETQRELHHQLLLYSYIVNRVIAEHSPNSIVAQTSLNVFYATIEAASPTLHKHVSDMAAFSLYVLCERSRNRSEAEIGAIYAELCDFDGQSDKIAEGNAFYKRIYTFCLEMLESAGYAV